MAIAIMGGTFNPVHYGHLRVAEEVRGLLNVDKVIFIPAFNPPHKDDHSFISSEHRIRMVSLCIRYRLSLIASTLYVVVHLGLISM